jgi:hypothetical protein
MRSIVVFLMLLVAAAAPPAFAQAPSAAPPAATAQAPPTGRPTAIRGTVAKFDDHTLAVKSRDGGILTVTLAPNFTVRTVVTKTLADLQPGDKVGITSIAGADTVRRAVEIHILPANIPNLRMAESPWDLVPNSLMTNAQVAQVSTTPQGRTLRVTLNGKEEEFAVPPATPIVGYAPGDTGLLQPGTTVFVFARKQPDGTLTAAGVTAEKNGVKPPM